MPDEWKVLILASVFLVAGVLLWWPLIVMALCLCLLAQWMAQAPVAE